MSPALTDLMAGNVQVLIVSLPSVTGQMKSGPVARTGCDHRETHELHAGAADDRRKRRPRLRSSLWWGIFAPAKTPKPVIDRLKAEIHKAMASPEMKKLYDEFGAEPSPTHRKHSRAMVKKEIAKWRRS